MKIDDEPIHIAIEETVAALRAAAFTEWDDDTDEATGRLRIHTFVDGPFMIGADWDLPDAVSFAERSIDRAWAGHPLGHELGVCADGRIVRFDCKRPAFTDTNRGTK